MNTLIVIAALFAAAPTGAKPADGSSAFFTLPVCQRVQVGAEVMKPGAKTWAPIEEGRFYPLGATFRAAKGGSLTVAIGKGATATVENGASFAMRAEALGTKSRTLVLTGGEVLITVPTGLTPGLFSVTSGSLTVVNPAGQSKYVLTETGDGTDLTVRCVTGTMEVKGRHYTIPAMRAADEFRVRSSRDDLETVIYGKSGDYILRLDRGMVTKDTIQDDGSVKHVASAESLDWHLSVATHVQINRAVPAIGERISVTMMTFDAAGTMKNHFAFAEGIGEVNTGELVEATEDSDDAAKNASATTDGDADVVEDEPAEETGADDGAASEDDAAADDSSDSDDSADADDDF